LPGCASAPGEGLHVLDRVSAMVEGAIGDKGRDLIIFATKEQAFRQVAFHMEGKVPERWACGICPRNPSILPLIFMFTL
jgi:hypothetical protein